MPYRLTPQETVAILEDNLQELEKTNNAIHQVQEIRTKLKVIRSYYPNFKDLEQLITEEFKKIGSAISGDDVLKKHDDPSKIQQKLKSIAEILAAIENIVKQNKITPPEDAKLDRAKRTPGRQGSFLENEGKESSCQWLDSDMESVILKSHAISSLKICFETLDHQMRLCSLCLSIFPESFEIKKRPLIYWWMGEGFIKNENKGEEIFKKLYRKGLVQPVHKGRNPDVDSCTIHPWMRKMLIAAAIEAEFLDFDKNGKLMDTFVSSQRACLLAARERLGLKDAKELQMLSLVFNVDKRYLQLESVLWTNLKRIKSLQLGRWQRLPEHHIELEIIGDAKKTMDESQDVLVNLGAMKQLRYLSLQGISGINSLPTSINELQNLEILDLRACHNLESLPSATGALSKLTHLDVTECYFLENMPKGIEKLSALQVLKGFVIGTHRTNACKLRDLSRLTNLRKLSLYIRNKARIVDERGDLKRNRCLQSLTITWGAWTNGTLAENYLPATPSKSFEFPKSLEKLDLRCYPDAEAPEWLSPAILEQLRKLYVRGGKLASLGQKSYNHKYPSLEILRLKYLKNMKASIRGTQKDVPTTIEVNGKQMEFPRLEYYEMARSIGEFPTPEAFAMVPCSDEDGEKELEQWTTADGCRRWKRSLLSSETSS